MCIRNTWHAGVFLHCKRCSVGIEKCPVFVPGYWYKGSAGTSGGWKTIVFFFFLELM